MMRDQYKLKMLRMLRQESQAHMRARLKRRMAQDAYKNRFSAMMIEANRV
jgi:hypothetical protein